jgi:phage N-6-adenine-methyltransferase
MTVSAFTEWATPKEFYDTLDAEFKFTVDVCAKPENAKHTNFISPQDNAMSQKWHGVCWMNPPYDKTIGFWMKKAYESSQQGATVVCLIQGRSTDTRWWHEYVMRANEIRYIKDRLHFGKHGQFTRSNISSVVVVFTPYCEGPPCTTSITTKGAPILSRPSPESRP